MQKSQIEETLNDILVHVCNFKLLVCCYILSEMQIYSKCAKIKISCKGKSNRSRRMQWEFNSIMWLLGILRVLMQWDTSIKHKASSWNGNKQVVIIIYKIKAIMLECAKYTLVAWSLSLYQYYHQMVPKAKLPSAPEKVLTWVKLGAPFIDTQS